MPNKKEYGMDMTGLDYGNILNGILALHRAMPGRGSKKSGTFKYFGVKFSSLKEAELVAEVLRTRYAKKVYKHFVSSHRNELEKDVAEILAEIRR